MSSNGLLIQPDATQMENVEELHRQIMQLVGRDLGLSDWGSKVNHTSYSSDTEYAHTIDNQGTGGHLHIPDHFRVQQDLVVIEANAQAHGTLAITGNTTVGGTLGVTGATTLAGLTAGATTLSSLGVTNDATVGGTMVVTGQFEARDDALLGTGPSDTVVIAGGLQALSITYDDTVGTGAVRFGAENDATPDLLIWNNANTQIGRITNEGLFLAGAQTAAVGTAAAGDVQANDLWLVNGANYRRLMVTSDTFQISANANGGAVDVTLYADGLFQVDSLEVLGTSNLVGAVTTGGSIAATGGISAGASSTFTGGLTVVTSNLAVSAGDVTLANTKGVKIADNGATSRTVLDVTSGNVCQVGNANLVTSILGASIGFFGSSGDSKQTVTGSRGGNAALASLITALANYNLITDNSS